MKFFTLPALLAAALFSAVVVIPFLPAAKTHPDLFALEVRLTSTANGNIQLYYDDGPGFSEAATSRAHIAKSNASTLYRLTLPPGSYRAFRLDPIDRQGTVIIESIAVVAQTGHVLRPIAFSEVQPANQIASMREKDGRLEVVTTPDSDDSQLLIEFNPPLKVHVTTAELASNFPSRTFGVFAVLAIAGFLLDRAPRVRARFGDAMRKLAAHPGRAVAIVAALAVIASAYPVIFMGKSYVSPNGGTTLLYGTFPTLPGHEDSRLMDVKGSDVGAMLWAHLPYSNVQHRALLQGELPLWNRYNTAGSPLLGQGQSMFGDPLHLFVVLCNGEAWAWDIKFVVAKWLFAFALGLLVLAYAQRLSAALIVGAAAPFIGFFVFRINHPGFFSLCYAPWVLYCWTRITQAASARSTALWTLGLLAANCAVMNSGTVKEAYMLLLAMNFSGACVLLAAESPWRVRFAKLIALVWAGGLFALLTAPIWMTFLHTLGNAYTGYNVPSAAQIQPALLLGLFDEIFYRPLTKAELVFNPSLNFLLLLGLLYFLATLRLTFSNRIATALAASSIVPLAFAFSLVPASWIVRVPFLGNVAHIDNCFSCAVIVLWSVLAGIGFARAAERLGTREGRGDLVVGALLLFALVFAWIGFRQGAHRENFGAGVTFAVLQPGQVLRVSSFVWSSLQVLLGASVVLGCVTRRALQKGAASPALAIVIALCAAVMLWRNGVQPPNVGFENYTIRPTGRPDIHARSAAVDFLQAARDREPMRAFGLHGSFFGGWTSVYGLEAIYSPDAIVNPWMRELVEVSGVERQSDWVLHVDPTTVPNARPFFDALNVRYYLDQDSDQAVLTRALKFVKAADLDIYESPTVWPRAFFSDRLAVYQKPAEFVQMIRTGDGRPLAAAQQSDVAVQSSLGILLHETAGRRVEPATHYRLTENTTSFDVHASSPGVVTLLETWWPGDFRAEVNGRKVPVLRLNHMFKGVTVDAAGDYHVTFRYVPRNFPRNLFLSGLGAMLAAGSLVLAFRRRDERSPLASAA